MKRRPRIYYSASQRSLMWERWRKGETLHQIARLFDRYHSSIQGILAEFGRDTPNRAAPVKIVADPDRARRDLSRCGVRQVDAGDRGDARPRTLYDQSRDPTQWWPARLSS